MPRDANHIKHPPAENEAPRCPWPHRDPFSPGKLYLDCIGRRCAIFVVTSPGSGKTPPTGACAHAVVAQNVVTLVQLTHINKELATRHAIAGGVRVDLDEHGNPTLPTVADALAERRQAALDAFGGAADKAARTQTPWWHLKAALRGIFRRNPAQGSTDVTSEALLHLGYLHDGEKRVEHHNV